MKTKQLFRFSLALLLLGAPCSRAFAAEGASARIKLVRIEKTNVVVEVEASGNFAKVTLESSTRVGKRAWEPRGVQVLTNSTETATTLTFNVPVSPAIEVLRVRADLVENTLPAQFFTGTNEFSLSGSADGIPVDSATGAPNTSAPGREAGDGAGSDRSVVESDIWKLDGDTLFFFNQYRGLQVIDVSDPDSPDVTGTYDLPGSGEQMYVINGTNVVLLALDNCSWYGSGNDSRVVLLQLRDGVPHLVKELPVPGRLAESRLVGSALYVVANSYQRRTVSREGEAVFEQWEAGTDIVSFDLSDFDDAREKSRDYVRGSGNAISATDRFLFVAQTDYNNWTPPYRSAIHCFDISSPAGDFSRLSTISVAGVVKDKFKMHVDGDTFSVVVQIDNWNANPRQVTQLLTYSLANPQSPQPLGSLKIIENEQLFATRFDGKKLYAVTFFVIDPVWIIDLSNPATPKILGELEIPGFSTYLHPMGDKLLAIGQDIGTDPTNRTWRTAVQLFDVANPAQPSLLSKVVIGDRYSSSEANWDEKAFGVLPEENLVLVPFSTYDADRYSEGVQLIDLEPTRLVKRGVVEHKMGARRATTHRGRLLSVSSRELLTVDIADRDRPAVVESTALSWAADRVHLVGDFLVEVDANDSAGPSLRVVDAGSPSTVRSVLLLTNLPYMGSAHINGKLYVLQGRGAQYLYDNDSGKPIGTNSAVFVLSTVDLSSLPELRLSNTVSRDGGDDYFYGQYQPVQVKPDVLVWANKNMGYWWGRGPIDIIGGPVAVDARAAMTDVARPGLVFPWWGGSSGHFIAVDLGGATPAFASDIKLTSTNGWWNFSDSFTANGLLYTSHQVSEYDPLFDPPPQTYICGMTGTNYITCTNDPPPGTWVTRYYLDVIDYSDPYDPLVRKPVNVPGSLIGLHRNGEILYTHGADFRRFYYSGDETIAAASYDGVNAHLVDSLVLNQNWPRPTLSDSGYVYVGVPAGTHNTNATIQVWTLSNDGKFQQTSTETLSTPAVQIEKINNVIVAQTHQIELYDARNPADLTFVGAGRAASCYGVLLDGADGEATRGVWLPVGWYGVVHIPITTSP